MLRLLILACVVGAAPAWAGCPPPKFTTVPKIIDLPYSKARDALTDAGFQPLLDWDRMQYDYSMPAEAWIAEMHYFEIQACSNMGAGECRANFVDSYRNLLRVITQSDPTTGGSKVADAFFVCGIKAANIFAP